MSRYRTLTESNASLQKESNEKEQDYERFKKDSIDFEKD